MNFSKAEFKMAAGKSSQLPKSDLPEVVFSGRSNVGKSSLINKIVNRKALARVSATPGKTGTINFFTVDSFHLVDLPGYGYAKVSDKEKLRWGELVEGYFADNRNIALVVQIVDMRHKPTADDMHMIEFLHNNGFPFCVVLTKKDKLNKTQQKAQLEAITEILKDIGGSVPVLPFSALNGDGIEDVRNIIEQAVNE